MWRQKTFVSNSEIPCRVCFGMIHVGDIVAVHQTPGLGKVHLRCVGVDPDPDEEMEYRLRTYRSAKSKRPCDRTKEEARIYNMWGSGWGGVDE